MAKKYNKKVFLAPDSIHSMSAIYCKVYEDGKAVIRISDCNNSIRFWNEIENKEGRDEMILKVVRLQRNLSAFLRYLTAIDEVKNQKPPF